MCQELSATQWDSMKEDFIYNTQGNWCDECESLQDQCVCEDEEE